MDEGDKNGCYKFEKSRDVAAQSVCGNLAGMCWRNYDIASNWPSLRSRNRAAGPVQPGPAINIWPGIAPGSEQWRQIEIEHDYRDGDGRIVRNVVTPTLTPYLPRAGTVSGTAVIVAPGGAFEDQAVTIIVTTCLGERLDLGCGELPHNDFLRAFPHHFSHTRV